MGIPERNRTGRRHRVALATVVVGVAVSILACGHGAPEAAPRAKTGAPSKPASASAPTSKAHAAGAPAMDEAASRDAFLAAYTVFMHPRCMNCHPSGDVPLQGDDSHLHAQNVKRGPDGKGLYAMTCSACHQDENVPGENMPPGNPNWHLPHPDAPLVFQGRTPAQLARQLKDPKQNGGKSLDQIFHHIAEDGLVLAGWNPGDGRTTPPLSHEEFVEKVRTWIDNGAAIPQ